VKENEKRELTNWNFVAIDGVIENQVENSETVSAWEVYLLHVSCSAVWRSAAPLFLLIET
jgi:hypothetical protein